MNLQVIEIPDGGHRVGVQAAARRCPRPDRGQDLGHPVRAGRLRADRARGQGATPVRGSRAHPLQGQEQTALAEGGQPRPRQATRHQRPRSAQLKTGRILRKLRCCPWKARQLAKAIPALQAREMEG